MNLNKLESKLDDALSKETTESLTNWLNNKRMKKKQTAVEWLAEQMMHPEIHNPYIEQAKQMEKEQREQDFIEGYKKRAEVSNLKYDEISESAAKSFFNKIQVI